LSSAPHKQTNNVTITNITSRAAQKANTLFTKENEKQNYTIDLIINIWQYIVTYKLFMLLG